MPNPRKGRCWYIMSQAAASMLAAAFYRRRRWRYAKEEQSTDSHTLHIHKHVNKRYSNQDTPKAWYEHTLLHSMCEEPRIPGGYTLCLRPLLYTYG